MKKDKIQILIKSFLILFIFGLSFRAFGLFVNYDSNNPSIPKEPVYVSNNNQSKNGSLIVSGFRSFDSAVFDLRGAGSNVYDLIINTKSTLDDTGTGDKYLFCCKTDTNGGQTIQGLAYWGLLESASGGGEEGGQIWTSNSGSTNLLNPTDKKLFLNSNLIYRENSKKFITLHSSGPSDSVPSTIYIGGAGPNINFDIDYVGPKDSVGIGFESLLNNKDTSGIYGNNNTAVGYKALRGASSGNTKSFDNTAIGYESMTLNQTGSKNSAFGYKSLNNNTIGEKNTAFGYESLNINTTGNSNTAVGYQAGTTTSSLSNTTAIGNGATVSNNNYIRFGNSAVTYIGGSVPFSSFSDIRLKKDIQDSNLGLDFIMKLRPVSYKYKTQQDDKLNYGFIAQELESILGNNTNIVHTDGSKEAMKSLRHTDLIAPLTRAIQEQQEILNNDYLKLEKFEKELQDLENKNNN